MTTSGTYTIDYDVAEFIDEAFERCGIDPATLGARHMRSARRSMNLLFSRWAANGVSLFAVDEQTQTVTDGTPSYSVATGTLAMLEVIVRRDGIDTPVNRIDRASYHAIPNKSSEGLPNMVYFDRNAGTYYLWNVPENSTDVIRYQRLRRTADVTAGAETTDVSYEWFEALASGMAELLSMKYAPDRFDKLALLAQARFMEANSFNRERVDTSFSL